MEKIQGEVAILSKNFELLQQAEKADQEAILNGAVTYATNSPDFPKIRPTNGAHHRLTLAARSREEVVKLVHRAFLLNRENPPRVVIFAGVDQGDGCSSICACAAEVLAAQGAGSTCVVDANFRTPSLHKFWALENERGLTDALKCPGNIRSFAQQVPGHNFWVLTSGTVGPDSHALLNDERMRLRITELRKEFDNVLIDVPPVNLYADALNFGHLADGVILILQSAATRKEAARKAKESLADANVRLLGAVLNKRMYPIPQALYERL
jgi:capsular exopolysaccharide synthesis family protein